MKESEERLALATALEAVTAAMIHDLSQPLAAIVTSGEACLRWLSRPEPGIAEAQAAVDRIVDTAMAAGEKLSRYRRLSSETRETVDLRMLAQGAIAQVADVGVPIALEGEAPAVTGDPVLLRIALLHVLRNAIEAIARGGGSAIAVRLSEGPAGEAILSVEDDGPGLPAEEKQLLKPFFSTVPGRLGLGLTIAKTVAESHGGRLSAAAREGAGASVVMLIP